MEDIYKLKLHETIEVGEDLERYKIMRVPGGWIYINPILAHQVFVPLNQEMKVKKSEDNEDKESIEAVVTEWNKFAKDNGLSEVLKITPIRQASIKRRLKENNFNIYKIFEKIKESSFLLGIDSSWKVSFDFIIESPNNYIKILEDKYQGSKPKVNTNRKMLI